SLLVPVKKAYAFQPTNRRRKIFPNFRIKATSSKSKLRFGIETVWRDVSQALCRCASGDPKLTGEDDTAAPFPPFSGNFRSNQDGWPKKITRTPTKPTSLKRFNIETFTGPNCGICMLL